MPKYVYEGDYPAVFGDLHAGVNATVEGKSHADGAALTLFPGDVVVLDEPKSYPFLREVTEADKSVKAVKAPKATTSKKTDAEAGKVDVPVEAPATDSSK